jgi:hypothetical protein
VEDTHYYYVFDHQSQIIIPLPNTAEEMSSLNVYNGTAAPKGECGESKNGYVVMAENVGSESIRVATRCQVWS